MRSLALVLLVACAAPGAHRPAPPPTASGPIAELVLEPYRTRLRTVKLRVGQVDGTFLLDTAGGHSVLTPDFAARIGCTPWGRVSGFRFNGDRLDLPRCDDVVFQVAGVELTAPTTGVLDIMPLLAADAAPVDGLLALDVFAGRAITLDVAGNRLWIESPASLAARVATMRDVGPVQLGRECQGIALTVNLPARTDKGTIWLELDSGNGGTILIGKHVAALLGLDPSVEGPQEASFPVLAGAAQVTGKAFTPDMILDGNLGMPFISHWVFTIDLRAAHMWIAPAG